MIHIRANQSVYFTGSRHGFHRIISRIVTAMTTTAYTDRILTCGKNTVLDGRPAMRQNTTQMMPACGLAAAQWTIPHGLTLTAQRSRLPRYTVWSEQALRPIEESQVWIAALSGKSLSGKLSTGIPSPSLQSIMTGQRSRNQ